MDSKGINLRKIDKMAGLSFENGLRLHLDSMVLFNNKSFPSAFFLSVLAIEEIGKSFLLMDFIFHSRIDGRMGEKIERKWIELIYLHRTKQNSFAFNFDSPFATDNFFKSIYKGEQEILKQNSVYIGLERNKRKINLKSRINNPLKINEKKAQDQITSINDCLLCFILGAIKEAYCVDADSVEKLLNEHLYNKLKKLWPYIHYKTKVRLAKLDKLE